MSQSIEQLIQQAISEAKAGNKANARKILSQVVKQEPGSVRRSVNLEGYRLAFPDPAIASEALEANGARAVVVPLILEGLAVGTGDGCKLQAHVRGGLGSNFLGHSRTQQAMRSRGPAHTDSGWTKAFLALPSSEPARLPARLLFPAPPGGSTARGPRTSSLRSPP